MSQVQTQDRTWTQFRAEIARGAARAVPIVVGYVPVGLAYGVLARGAGLSFLHTMMLSLMVFAGSSQFIAVGMLSGGASMLSIIITTFVVNLRHMLMSAALSPYLRHFSKIEILGFTFQLTDESFAVHSATFSLGVPQKPEIYALNMTAYLSWAAGSALGSLAGQLITDTRAFGLDYALLAMFAALLVVQLDDRKKWIAAAFTGLLSTGLVMLGMAQWNVIAAALAGATFGTALELWTKRE